MGLFPETSRPKSAAAPIGKTTSLPTALFAQRSAPAPPSVAKQTTGLDDTIELSSEASRSRAHTTEDIDSSPANGNAHKQPEQSQVQSRPRSLEHSSQPRPDVEDDSSLVPDSQEKTRSSGIVPSVRFCLDLTTRFRV